MGDKEFWDNRYMSTEYAFGEEPNEYLKSILTSLAPGRILFPAEGEGRNAVFAAKLGWEVFAFDLSKEGKKKAELLAQKNGVSINYSIASMDEISYPQFFFDAIAIIYAHFDQSIRSNYHNKLSKFLKSEGHLILESFSKEHLDYQRQNPNVGGPKETSMLYSLEDIATDFSEFTPLELVKTEVDLQEGIYHVGKGSAIRFLGMKK